MMTPASLRMTRGARSGPGRASAGRALGEQQGSALVMALILLVLLVTLATAAATTVRLRGARRRQRGHGAVLIWRRRVPRRGGAPAG